jgi:hypothetical protein
VNRFFYLKNWSHEECLSKEFISVADMIIRIFGSAERGGIDNAGIKGDSRSWI